MNANAIILGPSLAFCYFAVKVYKMLRPRKIDWIKIRLPPFLPVLCGIKCEPYRCLHLSLPSHGMPNSASSVWRTPLFHSPLKSEAVVGSKRPIVSSQTGMQALPKVLYQIEPCITIFVEVLFLCLMTRVSWRNFCKNHSSFLRNGRKLTRSPCLACSLFCVVSSPAFYGGWGMREGGRGSRGDTAAAGQSDGRLEVRVRAEGEKKQM